MNNPPPQYQRLRSQTVSLTLELPAPAGEKPATHDLAVCLAYDRGGALREINMVSRGKIGHGLDLLLHDLGIKLSRAIQFRHPDTGSPME